MPPRQTAKVMVRTEESDTPVIVHLPDWHRTESVGRISDYILQQAELTYRRGISSRSFVLLDERSNRTVSDPSSFQSGASFRIVQRRSGGTRDAVNRDGGVTATFVSDNRSRRGGDGDDLHRQRDGDRRDRRDRRHTPPPSAALHDRRHTRSRSSSRDRYSRAEAHHRRSRSASIDRRRDHRHHGSYHQRSRSRSRSYSRERDASRITDNRRRPASDVGSKRGRDAEYHGGGGGAAAALLHAPLPTLPMLHQQQQLPPLPHSRGAGGGVHVPSLPLNAPAQTFVRPAAVMHGGVTAPPPLPWQPPASSTASRTHVLPFYAPPPPSASSHFAGRVGIAIAAPLPPLPPLPAPTPPSSAVATQQHQQPANASRRLPVAARAPPPLPFGAGGQPRSQAAPVVAIAVGADGSGAAAMPPWSSSWKIELDKLLKLAKGGVRLSGPQMQRMRFLVNARDTHRKAQMLRELKMVMSRPGGAARAQDIKRRLAELNAAKRQGNLSGGASSLPAKRVRQEPPQRQLPAASALVPKVATRVGLAHAIQPTVAAPTTPATAYAVHRSHANGDEMGTPGSPTLRAALLHNAAAHPIGDCDLVEDTTGSQLSPQPSKDLERYQVTPPRSDAGDSQGGSRGSSCGGGAEDRIVKQELNGHDEEGGEATHEGEGDDGASSMCTEDYNALVEHAMNDEPLNDTALGSGCDAPESADAFDFDAAVAADVEDDVIMDFGPLRAEAGSAAAHVLPAAELGMSPEAGEEAEGEVIGEAEDAMIDDEEQEPDFLQDQRDRCSEAFPTEALVEKVENSASRSRTPSVAPIECDPIGAGDVLVEVPAVEPADDDQDHQCAVVPVLERETSVENGVEDKFNDVPPVAVAVEADISL